MQLLHKELTDKIIRAFYKVYNTLGYGFLEKVYENALKIELENQGLSAVSQMPIRVHYNQKPVGEYVADLCVEDSVIIEVKAAENISEAYKNQLTNYLKATGIEVGLVLNFGPKPDFARRVFQKSSPR